MSFFIDEETDVDPEKDYPTYRVWNLPHNKLHFQREQQYGFWKMWLEKGRLPDRYCGLYTSYPEAKKAAEGYFSSKKLKTPEEDIVRIE